VVAEIVGLVVVVKATEFESVVDYEIAKAAVLMVAYPLDWTPFRALSLSIQQH